MKIGIDLVNHEVFENGFSNSFMKKYYSINEIKYCNDRSNPLIHFAARFAAKEAIRKAGFQYGYEIDLKEIEILSNDKRIPSVNIANSQIPLSFEISLSHSSNSSIAAALAQLVKY